MFDKEDLVKWNDLSTSLQDIIFRKITWDMLDPTLQEWLLDKERRIIELERWRREKADPMLADHERRITIIETVEIPAIWGPDGKNTAHNLTALGDEVTALEDELSDIWDLVNALKAKYDQFKAEADSYDYGLNPDPYEPDIPDFDSGGGDEGGDDEGGEGDGEDTISYNIETGDGYMKLENGVMFQWGANPTTSDAYNLKAYPHTVDNSTVAIIGNDAGTIGTDHPMWVTFNIRGTPQDEIHNSFDTKTYFAHWANQYGRGREGGGNMSWFAVSY